MRKIAAISVVLLMVGLCFAQATVAGHVYVLTTAANAGRTLAGATVTLVPVAANTMPPVMVYRTVTGTDGSYSFAPVRAGTYQLVVTARGYAQLRTVRVVVTAPTAGTTTRIIADAFMAPVTVAPIVNPGNRP
jgi:hypothetical protein